MDQYRKSKAQENHVLVEFPEDASYFEENGVGFPCFTSEDNGARYVPESEYTKYFGHKPDPGQYYCAVQWPESQELLDQPEAESLIELINDERGLNDFGGSAYWAPLSLLNKQ